MGGWTVVWSNAALAIGAVALIVPFVVHLMTKRTPRTLVFPTVQFLKRAHASQSRLFRMRDLILLLVRTAFIVLLLTAFLKPILRVRAMTANDQRPQAAIIVVDASLSMQYDAGGVTPYARAQRAAAELLDHLPSDAESNLILLGATPKVSLDTPGAGAALLRDIQTSSPTLERGDVAAALDEAVNQLASVPERAGTIYLVSDFQRANWASAPFKSIPDDINLIFSPVGERGASNVAITSVVLRPRAPVVSESVEIICTISNYGSAAIDVDVVLELEPIGEEPARSATDSNALQRSVHLAASSSGSVTFRLRPTQTGSFEGSVHIPDDGLLADNVRYFTFDVHGQIAVLLVSDVARDGDSSGYFLMRALNPFATGRAGGSMLSVQQCRARDLDFASAEPQVLVLDGAGPLPARAVEQIAEYLTSGGALVYFLSDALDSSNLDAIAKAANASPSLPFRLKGMVDHSVTGKDATFWASANFDEPILRRFKEGSDLASLKFYRYYATEREEGRGQVLARYADGNFALGKGALGAGAILLCNFSASRDASDMATRPVFIPLLHEIVKSMRPLEGESAHATVGHSAVATVPAFAGATGMQFFSPSGKAVSASTDQRGERLAVMIAETTELGCYRVMEGSHHVGSLPVNVDALESDLLPLSLNELEQLAASPKRKMASAAGRDLKAIESLMDGVPIWPYLLLGAVCMLAAEQLFLLMIKK